LLKVLPMLRTLLRPLLPHRPNQNLLLKLQSRNKMKLMPSLSTRPLLPLVPNVFPKNRPRSKCRLTPRLAPSPQRM
jgi:hypothetical protein